MERPYWTEADEAELDALCWALVSALEVVEGPKRTELIEDVIAWMRMRLLLSKAEWLRRRHLYGRLSELEELVA